MELLRDTSWDSHLTAMEMIYKLKVGKGTSQKLREARMVIKQQDTVISNLHKQVMEAVEAADHQTTLPRVCALFKQAHDNGRSL